MYLADAMAAAWLSAAAEATGWTVSAERDRLVRFYGGRGRARGEEGMASQLEREMVLVREWVSEASRDKARAS